MNRFSVITMPIANINPTASKVIERKFLKYERIVTKFDDGSVSYGPWYEVTE